MSQYLLQRFDRNDAPELNQPGLEVHQKVETLLQDLEERKLSAHQVVYEDLPSSSRPQDGMRMQINIILAAAAASPDGSSGSRSR